VTLLDTNVISELVRRAPDPAVLEFVRALAPDSVFTASVCEAEIRWGLARMPPGRRREELTARIGELFLRGFAGRILAFDSACAALYGEIRAGREAGGKPIAVEDAMIAATARAYGVALATRNVSDFAACGVGRIANPWDGGGERRGGPGS
jgi:toxin FitB